MSEQQYELNTSRFVSAKKMEAGKQLDAASQDRIKRIMLPVEQTAGTNVAQSHLRKQDLRSTTAEKR